MIVLGASCTRLRRLNVANCAGLSGRALAALHCPDLEALDAAGLPLADDALDDVLAGAPRLRVLGLRGCGGLTDDALSAIADRCPSLVELDVANCGFAELPVDFGDRLATLEKCNLSGNEFAVLVRSVAKLHCRDEDLDLSDNPWTRPPADVVDEGMDAVNDHFDDIFGANDESDRWPPIGYPATEFGLSKFRDAGRLGLHRDAIQAAPRSPFSMILRRRHDFSRPPRPD
ncbi:hypothetical protein JL720_4367 [Aureococcus anophagefferens]|nr:hypothetical protein JL720_4367 [Aureococcus anophagefferens]